MNLILLPGNAKKYKGLIDLAEKEFSPLFDQTAIQYYDHWWEDSEGIIDLSRELDSLSTTIERLDKYMVVAFSAGVLLSTYAVHEGILSPDVCVFVGTPIAWAKEHDIDCDPWFRHFAIPSLFIQKENDPYISSLDLQTYLADSDLSHFEVQSIPGSDHNYTDIPQILSLTQEFVDL